mmetsp:Transcript_71845/g.208171  ORF Transcript_71845/g.208171 Transcript_71845/m.208171 type:complete len:202 (+) Transcript_71845:875-1480(+)
MHLGQQSNRHLLKEGRGARLDRGADLAVHEHILARLVHRPQRDVWHLGSGLARVHARKEGHAGLLCTGNVGAPQEEVPLKVRTANLCQRGRQQLLAVDVSFPQSAAVRPFHLEPGFDELAYIATSPHATVRSHVRNPEERRQRFVRSVDGVVQIVQGARKVAVLGVVAALPAELIAAQRSRAMANKDLRLAQARGALGPRR